MNTSLTNQPTHNGENQLRLLDDELQDQIWRLAQDGTDSFDERLWQILAAHRREIARLLNKDLGSPKVFEQTYVAWIVTIRLFAEQIERLSAKHHRDVRFSDKDRMVTRLLGGALDALEAACHEFKERFEVPDLKVDLGKKIFFSFWSMTKAEAENIAAESVAITDGTETMLANTSEAA